jgi:signal transduction histidine kinase
LGLAIAARIADAHQGAIEVADRPGGGSVFTVRLPALAQSSTIEPEGALSPEIVGSR